MKITDVAVRALPFLALLVVGIAIGWYLKPAQTQIQEKLKVVEVEKQVVVTHDVVKIQVVRVKDSQLLEKIHRETVTEKRPDGTVVTRSTEDKNIDSVVHDKENNTQVQVVTVEKQVIVKEQVDKVIKPVLPNWSVGVMAGLQPSTSPTFDLLHAVYGLEVRRRIVGPLWVGAWGHSGSQIGTYGLSLNLEF